MDCPCGSENELEECCGPVIDGSTDAATAEALMRARYTAYATNQTDFVISSHDPETRDDLDVKATRRWAAGNQWLNLEILETEAGGAADDEGIVEFVVTFADERARTQTHHERSEFVRREGQWHFHDGEIVVKEPVRSEKVGRNEPCPCGSGKKYKKCHGRAGAD